jgi:FtsP/CotA-like multicopper oxidase with cupredoxin domain
VTAGAAGSTWLRTLFYATGPIGTGDEYPDTPLMKVDVQYSGAGPAAAGAPAGMAAAPRIAGPMPGSLPDLSAEPIARSRTLDMNDDGGTNFYFNDKMFDHMPTFTTPATLGTVEEWTLTNKSIFGDHPFHLHTGPFQVISTNGVASPSIDYKDVMIVPAAVDGVPGKVVIRIRFTNYPGKWNFHCHVTGHEQNGMMGYLNVIAAGSTG